MCAESWAGCWHGAENGFATWLFQPAATGWYPRKAPHAPRPAPVLADPWAGVPLLGRNAAGRARNFDPRKFLKAAMDAMRVLCRDRFERFGTAGNASRIKVLPMAEMAKRYNSGSLDPQIAAARAA